MPLPLRFLSLLCACTLVACRNDFTLQADLEDVPVIYGYLDAAAPVHYLRVERAVAGADAGAMPSDPAQLYYGPDAAAVTLTNIGTGVSVEMERVDGNDLGLSREAGPFAVEPNILYRAADAAIGLSPGQAAEVRVQRPGQPDAVATTTLLEPLEILRPATTARLDDYRRPLVVAWNAPPEAAVFAVQLIFPVAEFSRTDPDRDRTVQLVFDVTTTYQPGGAARSGERVNLEIDPETIYRFIGQSLERDEDIARRLTTFAVRVTAVGPEVGVLLTLVNAGAGLTGAQPRPRYTNVVNGEGLLSSRTFDVSGDVQLDGGSLDSLREGRYTRNLNFQ